jgi:hypothetical protein
MTDAAEILARLRATGPDGAAARLAALLVDNAMARPVGELVDAAHAAVIARDALLALTKSDAAADAIAARLGEATATLSAEKRPLKDIIAKPLQDGARALAQLPTTAHREAVLKMIDREPLKQLLRAQVAETLVAFGKKAASPVADNPLARGLGGLSKRLAQRPSPLGAIASAISGEVERQIETRAADFADTAVESILHGIADSIGDPARAKEQAAMRAAFVDGFLELSGRDLADLARGNAKERVAAVRTALAAWAADPSMGKEITDLLTKALEKETNRPLGNVLADLAIKDSVSAHARVVVEKAIARVVATDAFARWLAALMA